MVAIPEDSDHVPGSTSDTSVVDPTQTEGELGSIGEGIASTVTGHEAEQPPDVVYNIVSMPAVEPVTLPEASTEAFVFVALQVPPVAVSVNVIVLSSHTWLGPLIGEGRLFTVIA